MTPDLSLSDRLAHWRDFYLPLADPHERLSLIIGRPPGVPLITAAERDDSLLVPGCQTSVWITSRSENDRALFAAEASSPLVRGLVMLQVEFYHQALLTEIIHDTTDLWSELRLRAHLSPTRLHGLARVRERLQALAASA
jgi:cysteine desulfuration protein SufE